jgi:hypothetical protein
MSLTNIHSVLVATCFGHIWGHHQATFIIGETTSVGQCVYLPSVACSGPLIFSPRSSVKVRSLSSSSVRNEQPEKVHGSNGEEDYFVPVIRFADEILR